METIGQQFKKAREKLHLTQEAMADRLGITTISYFKYETGKGQPSYKVMQRFANKFGKLVIYPKVPNSLPEIEGNPLEMEE
jgi:transcriptional regulator with XRE-family HTH domain